MRVEQQGNKNFKDNKIKTIKERLVFFGFRETTDKLKKMKLFYQCFSRESERGHSL